MDDLFPHDAPGLPANWLNGWLAAIGVTVLLPHVKLSWTEDVVPHAVLWARKGCDIADEAWLRLPRGGELENMAISYEGAGGKLPQKVSDGAVYRARAKIARKRHDSSLQSSLTDLAFEQDGGSCTDVARGQFCVGAEGSETLWRRLKKCVAAAESLPDPVASLRATLFNGSYGAPIRVHINGLGFDPRRLATGVSPEGGPWPAVDPLVEVLAFCGIQMFPVRGAGTVGGALQKPWRREGGRTTLTYPCWNQPLDKWAIDAFLDVPSSELGVSRRFRVRKLRPTGSTTKSAYFSEPVE